MIIFITSHHSPHNCRTLDLLNKLGYSGEYRIVIDDEDKYINDYKIKYKDNLVVFNKQYYIDITDSPYRPGEKPKACVVYARNAIEDYCLHNNIKIFCVSDDDLTSIDYKTVRHDLQGLRVEKLKYGDINYILDEYVNFLLNSKFAVTGFGTDDFYFGYHSVVSGVSLQKWSLSNFFIRNRDIDIKWLFPMEDFDTAICDGVRGKIHLPHLGIKLTVAPQYTQKNGKVTGDNGMINFYQNTNDFIRAFYSVIIQPSFMRVKENKSGQYIPSTNRNFSHPKIISSKYKLS